MSAPGRLYGVGIGPGDPELLTVKATRVIAKAPVVAFFAKAGRRGNARAAALLPDDHRVAFRRSALPRGPGALL